MKRLAARMHPAHYAAVCIVLLGMAGAYFIGYSDAFATVYERTAALIAAAPAWPSPLDKDAYNARMLALSHYRAPAPLASLPIGRATTTTATTTLSIVPVFTASTTVSIPGSPWPVATVYPHGGAILPEKRIIAYYGNFYSRQMGVLGEYPESEVLAKLASTTAAWAAADPTIPAIPAIHYIAVVAQGSAGRSGLWRSRMPDEEIDKALAMARELHGLLFLDVQVGQSTLQSELPALEKYLSLPSVHLGIDPEFSMKYGNAPGTVIGTFNAADINYAAQYLAGLVKKHQLPPKVLVVHRFTQDMVTGYRQIRPEPEVQIVMDMDGWGSQAKKKNTYMRIEQAEPVQFTGLKLFYHADLKGPSTGLLTKDEVLSLTPVPVYIQYQ
ncbi:MAG: hypothetical protein Q7S95_01695 [bacterium]|nr:hypothetical protein [bacterium]